MFNRRIIASLLPLARCHTFHTLDTESGSWFVRSIPLNAESDSWQLTICSDSTPEYSIGVSTRKGVFDPQAVGAFFDGHHVKDLSGKVLVGGYGFVEAVSYQKNLAATIPDISQQLRKTCQHGYVNRITINITNGNLYYLQNETPLGPALIRQNPMQLMKAPLYLAAKAYGLYAWVEHVKVPGAFLTRLDVYAAKRTVQGFWTITSSSHPKMFDPLDGLTVDVAYGDDLYEPPGDETVIVISVSAATFVVRTFALYCTHVNQRRVLSCTSQGLMGAFKVIVSNTMTIGMEDALTAAFGSSRRDPFHSNASLTTVQVSLSSDRSVLNIRSGAHLLILHRRQESQVKPTSWPASL